jgi:hypothetical protein
LTAVSAGAAFLARPLFAGAAGGAAATGASTATAAATTASSAVFFVFLTTGFVGFLVGDATATELIGTEWREDEREGRWWLFVCVDIWKIKKMNVASLILLGFCLLKYKYTE